MHIYNGNMDSEELVVSVSGLDSQRAQSSKRSPPTDEVFQSASDNVNTIAADNMPSSPSKIPKKSNFTGKSTIRSRG